MNWCDFLSFNPFLTSSIASWLLAQTAKVILYAIINNKVDIKRFWGDGGMPSGHAATVSSLALISGLIKGFGSFEFSIAFILAVIVCHDAVGVRRETEKQAHLLKKILMSFDISSFPKVSLREFVGHTPVQVLVGVLIGMASAVLIYTFML